MPNGHVNGSVKNLRKRTDGERLWLYRRVNDLTQEEASALFAIPKTTYYRVEIGAAKWPLDFKVPGVNHYTLGDLCALARRRHGKGLHGTADLMGCTHVTLLARENKSDPDLVKAWRRLGYRF